MLNRLLLLLLIGNLHMAQAQNKPVPFTNLVLEGGGVKGLAYVGALEILDSAGLLAPLERVGGSSAGAIQATLLALGYTPTELKQILAGMQLRDFNDGSLVGGYGRMRKRFGFYKGKKVHGWLKGLIAAKTGDSSFTFGQLHALKAAKGYKDLYITGTDLSYRCLRVFSHETNPDMSIATALRISMSIPLYFEPVVLDAKGCLINTKPWPADAHIMVDGGMLSNFPIHLFDSTRFAASDPLAVNQYFINPQTLGILLDKPEEIEAGQMSPHHYPLPIDGLRSYMKAMYLTLVDKPVADDAINRHRTVLVSHLNISGRVRQLPVATVNQLVESGRQGARAFLRGKRA